MPHPYEFRRLEPIENELHGDGGQDETEHPAEEVNAGLPHSTVEWLGQAKGHVAREAG